jgi:hypothetical protein
MTGIILNWWLVIGLIPACDLLHASGIKLTDSETSTSIWTIPRYHEQVPLPHNKETSIVSTTSTTVHQLDNELSPSQPFVRNNNENARVTINDQTLHGIVDWMKKERQILDEEFWNNQNDEPNYDDEDIQSGTVHVNGKYSKGYRRKLQATRACVQTRAQITTQVSKGVRRIAVCASKTAMGGAARRRNLKESSESNHHRELAFSSGGGINLSNRNITFVCILKNKPCTLDGQGNSRLFYGANTKLRMIGFVLSNASSADKVMGGGALSFFGSSNIELYKTTLSNNNAPMGGAIMLSNSTLTTRNVQYQDNAGEVGGAIYGVNSNVHPLPKSKTTMQRNHAVDDGGAIYMIGGQVSLRNVVLSNNSAWNSVSMYICFAFTCSQWLFSLVLSKRTLCFQVKYILTIVLLTQ